jgi:secondary thiamine-phosphate synthase enzyme
MLCAMRQAHHTLEVATAGAGLFEITGEVTRWVEGQGLADGLLTVFCRHTSASLLIQENADPDVQAAISTKPRGRTTCRPISARP